MRGVVVDEIVEASGYVIPRLIWRTVPEQTTDEVETFWLRIVELHPDWRCVTMRDPLDEAMFPMTAQHWHRCSKGAQLAGLVRLELLYRYGGVYLDSDVELYQPLDPLRYCRAFAAWEDARTVPDAVIGCVPRHPAIALALDVAIDSLEGGPWASGPGALTAVFPGREDVLLLPPASFYPYHYSERHRRHEDHRAPYTFGAHHWAASWLT